MALGDPLSPRQQQVVDLAALSRTDEEIASTLAISVSTVRAHLEKALEKLGLHEKRQLTSYIYGREQAQ